MSYSPGPGTWLWLKIEMDKQSSLPCPIAIPFLGLFENIESRVYFIGEGEEVILESENCYNAISVFCP